MAELVDALVSNTNVFGRAGSSPALGTSHKNALVVMVTAGDFFYTITSYRETNVHCFIENSVNFENRYVSIAPDRVLTDFRMKFNQVQQKLKGVPFISDINAKKLYDFIVENKVENILELGFAHGTASCYIAAALDELGLGKLTSVDLKETKDVFQPGIEEQLTNLKLTEYVEIHRMQTGYNWFLHNEIKTCSNNEKNKCVPKYDLIIIDGPKNWTIDSSSFFLSDKLLKDNGWILWDDYNWTYAQADKKRDQTDGVTHRNLSVEERETPHIKEIFELLVMQHPDYSRFEIQEASNWVWANKLTNRAGEKSISYKHAYTLPALMTHLSLKIYKKIKLLFSKVS